jgi:hypothetical protein
VAWATGLVVLAREPRPPMIDALLSTACGLAQPFGRDA